MARNRREKLLIRTMPNPVKTCRLTEIREDVALAAGTLLDKVWPKPDRGPVERAEQLKRYGQDYSGPEDEGPISHLIWDDKQVIAHALTFCRRVKTSGGEIPVLALAMVGSDPTYRGQGLGAAVANAALARVDGRTFPFCVFQTSFAVQPFYERLGAALVENRIYNSLSESDPKANPFWHDVVMRYPAEGDWPEGDIDLVGSGY